MRNDLTISGERNLATSDITTLHGLAVTTRIRTAWDLGRVRWPDEAITGLDAMFRLGGFERQAFLEGMRRFRGMRWVTTLRTIGPLADGRSESPGESVLRLRCRESPLPPMTPQVEVFRDDGSLLARLDLANEEHKLAVEYDGFEWHSSPAQQAYDRRRRDDLVALGWRVGAYTARNVFGHDRDIEVQLRRLVERPRVA